MDLVELTAMPRRMLAEGALDRDRLGAIAEFRRRARAH